MSHQAWLIRNRNDQKYNNLGIAYAGTNRDDVIQMILPLLSDPKSNMEVIGE